MAWEGGKDPTARNTTPAQMIVLHVPFNYPRTSEPLIDFIKVDGSFSISSGRAKFVQPCYFDAGSILFESVLLYWQKSDSTILLTGINTVERGVLWRMLVLLPTNEPSAVSASSRDHLMLRLSEESALFFSVAPQFEFCKLWVAPSPILRSFRNGWIVTGDGSVYDCATTAPLFAATTLWEKVVGNRRRYLDVWCSDDWERVWLLRDDFVVCCFSRPRGEFVFRHQIKNVGLSYRTILVHQDSVIVNFTTFMVAISIETASEKVFSFGSECVELVRWGAADSLVGLFFERRQELTIRVYRNFAVQPVVSFLPGPANVFSLLPDSWVLYCSGPDSVTKLALVPKLEGALAVSHQLVSDERCDYSMLALRSCLKAPHECFYQDWDLPVVVKNVLDAMDQEPYQMPFFDYRVALLKAEYEIYLKLQLLQPSKRLSELTSMRKLQLLILRSKYEPSIDFFISSSVGQLLEKLVSLDCNCLTSYDEILNDPFLISSHYDLSPVLVQKGKFLIGAGRISDASQIFSTVQLENSAEIGRLFEKGGHFMHALLYFTDPADILRCLLSLKRVEHAVDVACSNEVSNSLLLALVDLICDQSPEFLTPLVIANRGIFEYSLRCARARHSLAIYSALIKTKRSVSSLWYEVSLLGDDSNHLVSSLNNCESEMQTAGERFFAVSTNDHSTEIITLAEISFYRAFAEVAHERYSSNNQVSVHLNRLMSSKDVQSAWKLIEKIPSYPFKEEAMRFFWNAFAHLLRVQGSLFDFMCQNCDQWNSLLVIRVAFDCHGLSDSLASKFPMQTLRVAVEMRDRARIERIFKKMLAAPSTLASSHCHWISQTLVNQIFVLCPDLLPIYEQYLKRISFSL